MSQTWNYDDFGPGGHLTPRALAEYGHDTAHRIRTGYRAAVDGYCVGNCGQRPIGDDLTCGAEACGDLLGLWPVGVVISLRETMAWNAAAEAAAVERWNGAEPTPIPWARVLLEVAVLQLGVAAVIAGLVALALHAGGLGR